MALAERGVVARVHARVRGRVQGVYFRASTQSEAQRLELAGWVRNRRDGTVELVAEGPPDSLDALMRWVAVGPPLSTVTNVDRIDCEPVGLEDGFTIRPTL